MWYAHGMSWWLIIGVALAIVGLSVWFLARRRSRAGIQTSMIGRAGNVGRLIGRSTARKAGLRARQLFSGRERRRQLAERHTIKTAEEVARLMGGMKGVFMKIGQIASFANEALPEEARAALRGLQREAPPMAFDLVRGVIEGELGGRLSDHFRDIDEVPLASASIGQVHHAITRDGHDVALKVQYPGVDDAIRSDLRFTQGIMAIFGGLFPNTDNRAMVLELKARLLEEIDYTVELANQRLFGEIWAGHPLIRVPRVFPALSRRRVLCQELVRGRDFYTFVDRASADDKRLAVHVLNDFVFDSMHIHGVFNGDPHPGNYLFHDDGGVTFLDFGCVKRFPPGFLQDIRALNRAIVAGDHQGFEILVKRIGIVLPGRPYDHDFVWSFFQYHAAPFKDDAPFAFTPDYLARAAEVMKMTHLRRLNLPPDLIFFNRITFGLNAIFERLDAHENFQRLYRRYLALDLPDAEPHPPGCAVVGVDLPERFMGVHPPSGPRERAFAQKSLG